MNEEMKEIFESIEDVVKERDELRKKLCDAEAKMKKYSDWWMSETNKNSSLAEENEKLRSTVSELKTEMSGLEEEYNTVWGRSRYQEGRADGMVEAMTAMFGGE